MRGNSAKPLSTCSRFLESSEKTIPVNRYKSPSDKLPVRLPLECLLIRHDIGRREEERRTMCTGMFALESCRNAGE